MEGNFGSEKIWRICCSKHIGRRKFGEFMKLKNIFHIKHIIKFGWDKFGEFILIRQIRQRFPPPKFPSIP